MVVYAVFHSSPRELLFASIGTGAILLAITAAGVLEPLALDRSSGRFTAREVNEM